MMEQEIDGQIGVTSAVGVQDGSGEDRPEMKGGASHFLPMLPLSPMVRNPGQCLRGQDDGSFLRRVAGRSLRDSR